MLLDDMDIKILMENFDIELVNKIDKDNVFKIFSYLKDNNIYYAKDLFLSSLYLFLLDSDDFIRRFEALKLNLGEDFANKLGEDSSLIELMYQ